jgi:hypothetical protein
MCRSLQVHHTELTAPAAAVAVAVRATRRRHHNPTAVGMHPGRPRNCWGKSSRRESATATLYPEPPTSKLIQPCIAGLANGLRCLYVSAQVAAVQMRDVGLSLGDVSP